MKVLVIGASRGIGFEFVNQYRADGAAVTATARDDAALQRLRGLGAAPIALDVTDAASAAAFAAQIAGEGFDVAIVNAGVNGASIGALDAPAASDFDLVMRTNVLGPMRMLALLGDAIAPDAKVAVVSSRMGSIGSRKSAGSLVYRASKAAVNSVLKDASLVLGKRAICISVHPGWVKTDMGGAGADLDVATSVAGLRRLIASLTAADSGSFRNYDGATIPW